MVDAYFRGYDVILVTDTTATTSPAGGLENVIYNAGRVSELRLRWYFAMTRPYLAPQSYGFLTDSELVNGAVSTKK